MIIKNMTWRIDEARDSIEQLEEMVDELESKAKDYRRAISELKYFMEDLEESTKNASHE